MKLSLIEIAEENLSKSIIKKKKVSYLNDQFTVHSGAGKIISDFIYEREQQKISEQGETHKHFSEPESGFSKSEAGISVHSEDAGLAGTNGILSAAENSFGNQESADGDYQKIEVDYSGIIKQEYDKGFEDGQKSAMKRMESEYKKKLLKNSAHLENLLEAISSEFEEYKNQSDKFIISLSIAIAEKILKHEVQLNDDTVITQIKDAIGKVLGVENVTVNINPQDEELLNLHKSEIINKFDALKELNIQSNEKIEQGGCKIESQLGNVDARLSTQLKIIEDALLENIKANKTDETD